LDWPAALALAATLGLAGDEAVELLAAAEQGARAGLAKLPQPEG
jgi:hypothetical protein